MSNEKAKSLKEQIDTEAILYTNVEGGLDFEYANGCVLQFKKADKERVLQLLKENNIEFEEANISKLFYYDRAYGLLEDKVVECYQDEEDFSWAPCSMSKKYFEGIVQHLEDTDPVEDSRVIDDEIKEYLRKDGCGID